MKQCNCSNCKDRSFCPYGWAKLELKHWWLAGHADHLAGRAARE
jgi:hypothetical protein